MKGGAAKNIPTSPKGGYRHTEQAVIPEESLSDRERKVLAALRASKEPLTVRQLARRCFPGMRARAGTYETVKVDGEHVRHGTAAAYRCVLNCLRRLVAGGYAAKVERGTYRATSR